eukprot:2330866-Rhodomonas_salina.2
MTWSNVLPRCSCAQAMTSLLGWFLGSNAALVTIGVSLKVCLKTASAVYKAAGHAPTHSTRSLTASLASISVVSCAWSSSSAPHSLTRAACHTPASTATAHAVAAQCILWPFQAGGS